MGGLIFQREVQSPIEREGERERENMLRGCFVLLDLSPPPLLFLFLLHGLTQIKIHIVYYQKLKLCICSKFYLTHDELQKKCIIIYIYTQQFIYYVHCSCFLRESEGGSIVSRACRLCPCRHHWSGVRVVRYPWFRPVSLIWA